MNDIEKHNFEFQVLNILLEKINLKILRKQLNDNWYFILFDKSEIY